ncbi:hypothetical protein Psta_3176 [Pirellula staleyi DSM 6068]|uniref:Uncharacterized protein n=1 Tax=Pirellula staleyi (strain ATCC 27377 / DSM 6068 / ICPB 4128) TaxID=530564 RepID=D2QWN7_PIRSD|nr:hypothetical protein Psta_3176 [Pirellula staleyi DSM 6068]
MSQALTGANQKGFDPPKVSEPNLDEDWLEDAGVAITFTVSSLVLLTSE